MDGPDDDGVPRVAHPAAPLGPHDLLDHVGPDADDERDDEDAGDGQPERDHPHHRVHVEVRDQVVGALELPEGPPEPVPEALRLTRDSVVVVPDVELAQHHRADEREGGDRDRDEPELLQLLAAGQDGVEVRRQLLREAQQDQQPAQPHEDEPVEVAVEDRLERQEAQEGREVDDEEGHLPEARLAPPPPAYQERHAHEELGPERGQEEGPQHLLELRVGQHREDDEHDQEGADRA